MAEPAASPDPAAPTPPRRSLGSLERWVLALAAVFLTVISPWFPSIHSANELARVYLAESIVLNHTVEIDPALRRHGDIMDRATRRDATGTAHSYSDKAPGVALLAVPAIALYHAVVDTSATPPAQVLEVEVRLTRFFAATLPTLILILLLFNFLKSQLRSPELPAIITLTYAFGSLATPYGTLAFGHQLSACLLFAVYVAVVAPGHAQTTRNAFVIGLLAGLAVLTEYQNVLLLLPLAVAWLVHIRLAWRPLVAALLGTALPATLLLTYHTLAFGSPWLTGYSFIASSFAAVHAQGLLGVVWPHLSAAYLSFLSPEKGLFVFAPWLLFALPGLRWTARPDRLALILIVLYALFVSALVYPNGGWTVSQRHLAPMVPLLLLPIGRTLESRWAERLALVVRPLFVGFAAIAVLIFTVSTAVWPHYPEHIPHPFWNLGLPLAQAGLLAPTWLGGGVAPWVLGATLLAVGLTLAGWLVLPALRARRLGQGALVCALAVACALGTTSLLRPREQPKSLPRDRAFIERTYRADHALMPRSKVRGSD